MTFVYIIWSNGVGAHKGSISLLRTKEVDFALNAKVFVLALTAFITGMAELSIGGILPEIADGLDVSVSAAGQLISVFGIVLGFEVPF